MNQLRKSSFGAFFMVIAIFAITGAIFIGILWDRYHPRPQADHHSMPLANPSSQIHQTNSIKSFAATPGVLSNYPDFKERPLPVAYESPKYQFTLENGKDTNVIRKLAHNPLEYQRMVDENSRIFQRQLVYLKETAASVFEQAKLAGQTVHELTLPGIDREMEFEIVKSVGNPGSSRQGMFSGHLAGNDDSLVTLAFQDGREAFTVLSPKDNLFVVGEPRESGQVIVKAIDPNTYGMGPEEQGDDSIKTAPNKK